MACRAAKGLRVISPGVLSLVQDLGRFGFQHLGLSTGGAADEHAFLWANRLLGNPPNSAALEICLGGLQLRAEVATRIAIAGANLHCELNQMAITSWRTYTLKPSDTLRFGYAKNGVRGYLAVQGGLQVEPRFGSVATVVREGLGGLDGRGSSLNKGDCLPCFDSTICQVTQVPDGFIPDYSKPLTLGIIETEGQQRALFDETELQRFYAAEYEISNQSDRMGARLLGPALNPKAPGVISEGVSFGTVQVPPNGQPIVLLKDRQTIGGYPKLGTVFALDAFLLSQQPASTRVRFEPMPLEEAERLLQRFYWFFQT